MKRNVGDLLFTLFLMGAVAAAMWEAQRWDFKAKLFPWVVGGAILGLLALQLLLHLRRLLGPSVPARIASDQLVVDTAQLRRRAISIVGWLGGFAAAIWLLSFLIGGTLATLAYLKLAARERWPISLAIAAGTVAFFWAMDNVLHVPFPTAGLVELLLPAPNP